MNSFEAKYIKISKEYLEEKLEKIKPRVKSAYKLEDKKESKLSYILHSLFRS